MIKSPNQADRTKYLAQLEDDVASITKSLFELTYFMRGAVTYHEALGMSPGERISCMQFINDRLKEQLKLPNPVF